MMTIGYRYFSTFVESLKHMHYNSLNIMVLFNHQKGLIDSVESVFPHSLHGYCLWHLEINFYKEFKHPQLKSSLWQAARATTEATFNEALTNIVRRISVRYVCEVKD